MSKRSQMNPLNLAIGVALSGAVLTVPVAGADENPFQVTDLGAGYLVADSHGEGKCGEGKCGGKMEGKCGGKMAGNHGAKMKVKMMDADQDGVVSRDEFMQAHDRKFTEMDTNEDGKVTEEELKMMMQKMHKGNCAGAKAES